jgi:hypothetical protein
VKPGLAALRARACGAREVHERAGKTAAASRHAVCRALVLCASAIGAQPAAGQSFVYVEPGVASCPAPPAPAAGARTVQRGVPVSGSIRVTCGFEQGSYTLTLNSTDPGAAFSPKTLLVNFGRIAGNGAFSVSFATVGVHSVSVAITSNMGSPPVRGHFASAASEFSVVAP